MSYWSISILLQEIILVVSTTSLLIYICRRARVLFQHLSQSKAESASLALQALQSVIPDLSQSIEGRLKHLAYLPHPLERLLHILYGPQLIIRAYNQSGGKSFKVATPANDIHFVTTPALLSEVNKASLKELSLHATAKDILQPKYTLPTFEWKEQRKGVEGTGYVRAIRAKLTAHIPAMRPRLEVIMRASLKTELTQAGSDSKGWTHVPIYGVMKRVITEMNGFMFFGEELSQNTAFCEAALDFPQVTLMAAELVRVLPDCLCSLGVNFVTRRRRAERTIRKYLEPIVEERLRKRAEMGSNQDPNSPTDCVQWLIDMTPRKDPWTVEKTMGQILSLWFATGFSASMLLTTMIEDICLHNEYVDPLRAEIKEHRILNAHLNYDELYLLESFMKESIRTTNSDAVTGRRKALEGYTFSDGSTVNKGDWVCLPVQAMMIDAKRYCNPQTFDGHRFLHANESLRRGEASPNVPDKVATCLTDTSFDWPIWGVGSMTCPGRWFASMVMKLVLCEVLENYDVVMPDTETSRLFSWRTYIFPKENTLVSFRKIKC